MDFICGRKDGLTPPQKKYKAPGFIFRSKFQGSQGGLYTWGVGLPGEVLYFHSNFFSAYEADLTVGSQFFWRGLEDKHVEEQNLLFLRRHIKKWS